MPDDNGRAADETRKLRARFPRWGIVFDPLESVWVAVRGKRTLVAASSPEKLTEQVEAAARGEAAPAEGDKTQTWRALRKHMRGLHTADLRVLVRPLALAQHELLGFARRCLRAKLRQSFQMEWRTSGGLQFIALRVLSS